jgi:hypothetical protein
LKVEQTTKKLVKKAVEKEGDKKEARTASPTGSGGDNKGKGDCCIM